MTVIDLSRWWTCAAAIAVLLLASGCTSVRSPVEPTALHRFFLELDAPGTAIAALHAPEHEGGWVRLLEIDAMRTPIGDTLLAWVQHFDGIRKLSPRARGADMVIACFRELQPDFAQSRHVLPESRGLIYVYMMRNGILAITDEKIPFYEVLVAPGGSAHAPVSNAYAPVAHRNAGAGER